MQFYEISKYFVLCSIFCFGQLDSNKKSFKCLNSHLWVIMKKTLKGEHKVKKTVKLFSQKASLKLIRDLW